ncbi:hypothetical protein [Terribacillus saccharophilus]|uniref:hypothetical protein n=1 Tax=Terribacillus saccharophilus TaxID=361277 RepID=UPI002989BBD4|nr:hypothetical protein [Terribacillus saccharophilus]MCM3225697.1 hypothetical protein [Terribacillus saccharophilus]MEC0281590.1 hypothetical protein [Terribacillus saccharophilus]MEC0291622.1 hypothetical protein [Terribacillus saccharophilus]
MKTKLTAQQVLVIANNYKRDFNLSGNIENDNNRTIRSYEGFDGVQGVAWLVLVSITPTGFETEDEYTIVISDEQAKVEYIIDPNGHYYAPHVKDSDEMSDEEFDAIWDEETN